MSCDTKSCKVLCQEKTDHPFKELPPSKPCSLTDLGELVSLLSPDLVMEVVVIFLA